jgi:hypothetical protein
MRGRRRTPEPIAVVPGTPWKYWGSVKRTPEHGKDGDSSKHDAPQVGLGAEQRQVEQRLAVGAAIDGALPGEEADDDDEPTNDE